jgi:hypothetical protein
MRRFSNSAWLVSDSPKIDFLILLHQKRMQQLIYYEVFDFRYNEVNPHCGLNGEVGYVADCCPRGAGFDSRVMYGFFPHVREAEDIGLLKGSKQVK